MTGQDAVTVAQTFNDKLDITGVIMTKARRRYEGRRGTFHKSSDGQTYQVQRHGEKMEDLEPFHPERMASRILGMGDVLTLIEKAEAAISQEDAAKLQKKLKENSFDLEDYLQQLDSMKKMGNLQDMMSMIPGFSGKLKQGAQIDEKQIARTKAIIQSMTPKERRNPEIIKASQKKRISKGSGTSIQEVNQLLKQFEMTKDMMARMQKGGLKGLRGLKGLF